MNKTFKLILIWVGVLLAIYFVLRWTGILQRYSIPANSMAPTILAGERISATNLLQPKGNSIIVFERQSDEFDGVDEPGKPIRIVSRLIAIGGETIQVKDGLAYVNGNLVDDSDKILFQYALAISDLGELRKIVEMEDDNVDSDNAFGNADSIALQLTHAEYVKASKQIKLTRLPFPDNLIPLLYQNDSTKKWTIDNYGPIKVPMGHYFVLGDNRNASKDSRYIGPVPIDNFKGTVIGKD